MPEARKKPRSALNPKYKPQAESMPAVVREIAHELGLDLEALRDWKVYASGKVVLIAPNGMKFVREGAPIDEIDKKTFIKRKSNTQPRQVKDER